MRVFSLRFFDLCVFPSNLRLLGEEEEEGNGESSGDLQIAGRGGWHEKSMISDGGFSEGRGKASLRYVTGRSSSRLLLEKKFELMKSR